MTKSELRKKYKTLRNTLSTTRIDDLSMSVANQLLKLPVWEFSFYHIFLAIEEKKEVNTRNLINDYNYYSDEIGDDLNTLNEICGDKSGIVNTEIMFKKEWICHISVQIGKKIFALTS